MISVILFFNIGINNFITNNRTYMWESDRTLVIINYYFSVWRNLTKKLPIILQNAIDAR